MYLGSWKIDDYLTIPCNTHTPSTGAATDADAVPTYRVYEDDTGTAIESGSTAKLDDANTTGFYAIKIQLDAVTGYEKGKTYTIYISATVGGVIGTMSHTFQIEAEVDANVVSDTSIAQASTALTNATWTDLKAGYITGAVALQSVCTETRLTELDAANLPTDIANVKAETNLIVGDTNELQTDWKNGGRLDLLLDACALEATVAALNNISAADAEGACDNALATMFTSAAQLVDDIWDEVLTGATHNIATSAGRRLRELGAYHITSGTAQGGAAHSITLAAADTAADHIYNRNLIVILAGTGIGQTRTIVDFANATKVAVVDRDWWIQPDATSEYTIIPDDTPLVTDHGVATAGTNNTITIRASASAISSTYSNDIILIMAGTGIGQSRLISSYNGGTKVVTVCENWTTNPDNTSVYVIIPYGHAHVCAIGVTPLADIRTQADDALTSYDPPTDAEMVARTLPSADYFDPSADNVALTAAAIDAILDEVIGDAVHATPNSVGAMLHAVYCRFMQKRTATDTVEKAYKLDDITELKAFTLADDGTTSSRT